MTIGRTPGKSYLCKGGPFHNKLIELTNGQRTLKFSVNGCKPGVYQPAGASDNPIRLGVPGFANLRAYDMVWVDEVAEPVEEDFNDFEH